MRQTDTGWGKEEEDEEQEARVKGGEGKNTHG